MIRRLNNGFFRAYIALFVCGLILVAVGGVAMLTSGGGFDLASLVAIGTIIYALPSLIFAAVVGFVLGATGWVEETNGDDPSELTSHIALWLAIIVVGLGFWLARINGSENPVQNGRAVTEWFDRPLIVRLPRVDPYQALGIQDGPYEGLVRSPQATVLAEVPAGLSGWIHTVRRGAVRFPTEAVPNPADAHAFIDTTSGEVRLLTLEPFYPVYVAARPRSNTLLVGLARRYRAENSVAVMWQPDGTPQSTYAVVGTDVGWSRDGQQLATLSPDAATWRVVDWARGAERQFVNPFGQGDDYINAAWFPDNRHLMIGVRGVPSSSLYRFDTQCQQACEMELLVSIDGIVRALSVHPADDEQVAVVVEADSQTRLVTLDLTTGVQTVMAERLWARARNVFGGLGWSPDGTAVAYTGWRVPLDFGVSPREAVCITVLATRVETCLGEGEVVDWVDTTPGA